MEKRKSILAYLLVFMMAFTLMPWPAAGFQSAYAETGDGSGSSVTQTDPAASTETPDHFKDYDPETEEITLDVTGKDTEKKVKTEVPGETTYKGTNLVMVIDISGSVIGKEKELNDAINSLVTSIPSHSQVGVVLFHDSATSSQIYDADSISQLKFVGVKGTGTYIMEGIDAATRLLNGSDWENKNNNKAMVIISDFDDENYTDSINSAKKAKDADISVYSVKINSSDVGEPETLELDQDNRLESIESLTHYISSEYPDATAVNPTTGRHHVSNSANVSYTETDQDATYVYGAAGGNWSEIFREIEETQMITTEITEIRHMTGIQISDVLSDYVELKNKNRSEKYGVTVDGLSADQYSVAFDPGTKKVTVTFAPGVELEDGKTYTARIPVIPTEKAQADANAAPFDASRFPTNDRADLTYQNGDDPSETIPYEEDPMIVVEKETFTVTWVDEDGETVLEKDEKVPYGTDPTFDKEDPTKDPDEDNTYEFSGWTPELSPVTGDVTYTASYEPTAIPKYKVTYTDGVEDETVFEDQVTEKLKKGDPTPEFGTDPVREGYQFDGWDPEVAETVSGDATYTAKWIPNQYKVTFDPQGGTPQPDPQTVNYKDTASEPETEPEKEGYTFDGWYPEDSDEPYDFSAPVTEDTNLVAKWTPVQYKVTFDPQGGTPQPDPQTVNYKDTASEPETEPEKEGYTFDGWYPEDSDEPYDFSTPVTEDTNLVAKWTPVQYKVTFDPQGGTPQPDPQTVNYKDTASEPETEPEKEGYTFDGWYPEDSDEPYDFSTPVTEDTNLVAKWTPVQYKVTFDPQGGTPQPDPQTVNYKDTASEPETEPEKEGYTFDGWYPEDSDEPYDFSTPVTEDTNLVAKWTPVQYKVTFDPQGGTPQPDPQTVNYKDTASEPETEPEKEGYTFDGWYPEDSDEPYDFSTPVTEDTNLVAKWTPVQYKVTFDPQGGTPQPDPQTVNYKDTASEPETDPQKNGYVFQGWYPEGSGDPYDFSTPVTEDITLVAHWEKYVPPALNATDHIRYIRGYEDGTVRPDGSVTRAEACTMLYRLLTPERRDEIFTKTNTFSDVTEDLWYNKAVSSMTNGGYINGYGDGTFRGDQPITRAELVSMLSKFYDGKAEGSVKFTDMTDAEWATESIAIAVMNNWVDGYPDGTFMPNTPIRRCETMKIINTVLNRGVNMYSDLGSCILFPDNSPSEWYYYEVIEATNEHEYTGHRPSPPDSRDTENWTRNATDYVYDIVKYEESEVAAVY